VIWLNVAIRSFAQGQLMHRAHLAVSRSTRSHVWMAAVIATVLLVTACSRDEPDTASGGETPGITTARSEATEVDVAERVVSEAPDAPSPETKRRENAGGEAGGGAGEVAGVDLNADYCEIAAQAKKLGPFTGANPQTPEDMAASGERTRQINEALVRQAPDEIADDVEVSARSISALLSVLEARASRTGEVGPDTVDDPEVQAAIEALDSEEVQKAHDRVDEWRRKNC
jgi:hypothetical protein